MPHISMLNNRAYSIFYADITIDIIIARADASLFKSGFAPLLILDHSDRYEKVMTDTSAFVILNMNLNFSTFYYTCCFIHRVYNRVKV